MHLLHGFTFQSCAAAITMQYHPNHSRLVSWVFEVLPGGCGELAGQGGRLLPGEMQSKLMIVDLTISILVTPACGRERTFPFLCSVQLCHKPGCSLNTYRYTHNHWYSMLPTKFFSPHQNIYILLLCNTRSLSWAPDNTLNTNEVQRWNS